MADPPGVNQLVELVLDGRSFPSRVEDCDDDLLTVAAPVGRGDVALPDDGHKIELYWNFERSRYRLLAEMSGVIKGHATCWQVRIVTGPTRRSRRRFNRGGGGGPVVVLRPTAQPEGGGPPPADTIDEACDGDHVDGHLIDISEVSARCMVQLPGEARFKEGDAVILGMTLAGKSLRLGGTVFLTRSASSGRALDIVVKYRAREREAQVIRQYVMHWEVTQRRDRDAARR